MPFFRWGFLVRKMVIQPAKCGLNRSKSMDLELMQSCGFHSRVEFTGKVKGSSRGCAPTRVGFFVSQQDLKYRKWKWNQIKVHQGGGFHIGSYCPLDAPNTLEMTHQINVYADLIEFARLF